MRLPSVQFLLGQARQSVGRFPFVMTAALVAAICGIAAIGASNEDAWVRGIVAAQLGIPLFFALAVAGEARRWPRGLGLVLVLAGALALVAYYISLPDQMRPGAVTRFVQFNLALHLLAAFSPFVRPGWQNGFWQYNKTLFLRFLVSAIYSMVVFGGLSVALLAVDKLLGLHFDEEIYPRLWVVVAFVFNTWMFIGGVPRDIPALEDDHDYPRGLRVFAQYVLMPLVVIYLTILTIYLVKVVITTEWPSGWIGYLVSSVAVVGILALLLVWPVADHSENRWVATYTRWFFIFMIPAIVMLLLAIYKRIDQYGITENRYFLAVLAVWLAAVAVYFVVARNKSIKVIPITLCVVALITSFGPWGAYTVARTSQSQRLERLMEDNGILESGAIVEAGGGVTLDDRREISSITRYLVEHHNRDAFARWLSPERLADLDSTEATGGVHYGRDLDLTRAIVSLMGFEYVSPWSGSVDREGHFNYAIDRGRTVITLDRPQYMARLISKRDTRTLGNQGLFLSWQDSVGVVLSDSAGVVLVAPIDSLYASIERNPYDDTGSMPPEVLRVSVGNERARLTVYFQQLGGNTREGVRTINHVNADCFVTIE